MPELNGIASTSSILAALGAACLWAPAPALAEATGLVVDGAEEIGPFDGKAFVEIEAHLEGTAPGGAYSVPVTLVLPKDKADHNGVALIDVVNTITIGQEGFVSGGGPLPLARIHMGDPFLFGRGHSYLSVIWDKTAVETLGNGAIADAEDGWTIIRDAAALARDPGALLPADAGVEPAAADRAVAYGYSQTGSLLRGWFQGRNTEGGAPAFDGGLVAGATGDCLKMADLSWFECPGPAADGAKVISLATQGDAEWGAFLGRAEHPDYRHIEIAGVSHIPAPAADFREGGMPEQNPVDFGPAFRGALVNVEAWLDGTEPPPSLTIDLAGEKTTEFGIRFAKTDADGNALGGLRLPHMPSDDGASGAPLGRYTAFAMDRADNIFFMIGGTFTPFPPERLAELYPTRQAYIDRVSAAANALAEQRYILPEDAAAYVAAAERDAPVP